MSVDMYAYAPADMNMICPKCNRDTIRQTQTRSAVNPGSWTVVYTCESKGCDAKFYRHIKEASRKGKPRVGFTPALGCQFCKRKDIHEWVLSRGGRLMCRDCKQKDDRGEDINAD